VYNLILRKVSSFDYDSELCTFTEFRQSSKIYFSLRSAWKSHPDFKSINFGGKNSFYSGKWGNLLEGELS
jgi:hypothetical protein